MMIEIRDALLPVPVDFHLFLWQSELSAQVAADRFQRVCLTRSENEDPLGGVDAEGSHRGLELAAKALPCPVTFPSLTNWSTI